MRCMVSSDVDTRDDRNPTIEFMVTPSLRDEIEEIAWENKMTKSELMRALTRAGVERVDEVLDDDDGAVRPQEIEA